MFINNKLAKAVRLAIVCGASSAAFMLPTASVAQEENDVDAEQVVEKISITGSRLRRPELTNARTTFTFDAEQISVRGFTNVAEILNQSPLFGGSQTPVGAQAAADAGQNQVNLFDLGTVRTLTLVNGRRFVSAQSATLGGSQVDLNSIPAALIDRIETVPLTGAASYGADAIAGTVNIILKDDYEGFEAHAQYGNNEAGNYNQINFGILGGGNFDEGRGNVTFGMEYTKDDGLLLCDQEFLCNGNPFQDDPANRYLDVDGDGMIDDINGDGVIDSTDRQRSRAIRTEQRIGLFTEFGAISPAGAGFNPGFGLSGFPAGFSGVSPDGNYYEWTQDGVLQTCNPGVSNDRNIFTRGDDVCGSDFFDSVAQIISPVSRFNTYASFRYDVSDEITYKADLVYSNSKASELVNQGGFQTGFFGGTSAALEFDFGNPFLTQQALDGLSAAGYTDNFSLHRFNNDIVSGGANSNENQTWRVTNVVEGYFEALDREFWWDVAVVHGRNDSVVQTTGIVDGRFLNAIDARRIDDTLLEQIRLQDPDDASDDLADLDAAFDQLVGARAQFTEGFERGDIICGAYADLAAGTLSGFNSRASGNGLVDEDLPFIDGCVPLNLFGDATVLNSPEALSFIQGGPRFANSDNTQTVYTVNLGGSIAELPAGPLDFVVGYERRIEESNYQPSLGALVPVTRTSIDQPVRGGFDTNEFYAEVGVPIISEDMDIPFVQALDITAAVRNQEFNTQAPRGFTDRTTEADVYQLTAMWQVNEDVTVRGTLASAFRNPTIQELFQPPSQAFVSGDDPCDARHVVSGPNPDVRRANCESIGIDTNTFVSSISDGTIPGAIVQGNQELTPEENDSYSVGIVYTPTYIEGLELALDYYNLEIEDFIEQLTFEDLAAVCFDSNDFPNEDACNTFVRDENFQVVSLVEQPINVATSTFESVTFRVFYNYDLGEYGNVSVDAFTQHNITNEFQATPASLVEEDVGDFADPDYLGTVDVNWTIDDFLVSYRTRWQTSVKIDPLEQTLYSDNFAETTGTLTDGTEVPVFTGNWNNQTGARFIHDLSIGYNLGESSNIQLNIRNLFDRQPDENGRQAWGVGHIGLDERLGRRFSLRVTHTF